MVDPVTEWLPDAYINALDFAKFAPHFIHELLPASFAKIIGNINLGTIDPAMDMGVSFSPARTAAYILNFRNRKERLVNLVGYLFALIDGNPGNGNGGDSKRTFIELRQKSTAQPR